VSADRSSGTLETLEEAERLHSLFRDVNERIRDLNEDFGALLPTAEWYCECADPDCAGRIEMTLAEYDAIRSHPYRFPVIPGHEVIAAERVLRVVARHSNYLVVEELDVGRGVSGDSAQRTKGRASA
jgi:hypothetical protein